MPHRHTGDEEVLRISSAFHPTGVIRRGDVIVRDSGPWTPAIHALLRHLEAVGFPAAPRLVGGGIDAAGRETLTFIPGDFTHPGPWSLDGAAAVGALLRDLHSATATFRPPADARWWPWFGRALGDGPRLIGHCDVAPWNIVARQNLPVALIDWERAGPTDPLTELAQACWLNAKLHDDRVAALEGLPPLAERARHLRAIVDGYDLPATARRDFVARIAAFAVHDAAAEADRADITPETRPDMVAPEYLWSLAWRTRAAAWILRHRATLQSALA